MMEELRRRTVLCRVASVASVASGATSMASRCHWPLVAIRTDVTYINVPRTYLHLSFGQASFTYMSFEQFNCCHLVISTHVI